MTEFEKDIYNKYLKAIANGAGRPYKLRKNFEGFEDDPKYFKVQKIASYLMLNWQVNADLFFEAPYKLYELDDGKSYTLDFYTTRKAKGAYKKYLKWLELKSPDLDTNLQFLKESIIFVYRYCTEHNLTFDEYMYYSEGLTPAWMTHYFDRKISIYLLLAFDKLSDIIFSMESTHRKMVLGNLDEMYPILKHNYLTSTIASKMAIKGITMINSKQST